MFQEDLDPVDSERKGGDASLLISGPNNGGLLYLNGISEFLVSRTSFTGMCKFKSGYLLAEQVGDANHIRIVTKENANRYGLSSSRADLHDVMWAEDSIYAVHTETNEIVRYTEKLIELDRFSFAGESDSCHINSIAFYKGRLIASMFGAFQAHRGYKGRSDRAGKVVDAVTGEVVIEGLSQPHSLTVHEDTLYLCNSERKELHKYRNQKLEKTLHLPGYTRGFCIHGDYCYVGLSVSRNIENENDYPIRSGAVATVNLKLFELEDVRPVPFQEIYDVEIIEDKNTILMLSENENAILNEALEKNIESVQYNEKLVLDLKNHLSAVEKNSNEQVSYRDNIIHDLEKKIVAINEDTERQVLAGVAEIKECKAKLLAAETDIRHLIDNPLRALKRKVQRL